MNRQLNNALPELCWDNLDRDMSVTEHLNDLRCCLLKSLAALAVGSGFSFWFIQQIIDVLTAPVRQLYYMRPAEAFMIYMKIALLSGLMLALPIILYQFYRFVRPALTLRERYCTFCTIPLIICLFLGGMLFSYYFVFPRALDFFFGFVAGKINPLISLESYLDFLLMLVVPFGFVFNIPVLIVLLVYLHPG